LTLLYQSYNICANYVQRRIRQYFTLISIIPFAGLLLTIALVPLWKSHWWERHTNKALCALLWSLPAFYFILPAPHELLLTFKDYVSFIILLSALFIISGGILLEGDIKATPKINSLFLLIGAFIANFIGTTGASMLLIRPILRTNQERKHISHIPIFYFPGFKHWRKPNSSGRPAVIFRFFKRVPFFWTLNLFPQWLFAVSIVLIIFYFFDRYNYSRETKESILLDNSSIKPITVSGKINFLWLAGVIIAVFLPFPYREIMMSLMASLFSANN